MTIWISEATNLLNEIMEFCTVAESRDVCLRNPTTGAKSEVDDCELHITGHFDDTGWICLKDIIRRHNLNVKEEGEFIVIYSSKKQSNQNEVFYSLVSYCLIWKQIKRSQAKALGRDCSYSIPQVPVESDNWLKINPQTLSYVFHHSITFTHKYSHTPHALVRTHTYASS